MLYCRLAEISQRFFPASRLEDLDSDECLQIIHYVVQQQRRIRVVAEIPEILTRVLGYLELRHRELTRLVNRLWNSVAESLRAAREVSYLGIRPATLHLGLHVCDPNYLSQVTTQDEFDHLWPFMRNGVFPRPEFITQDLETRIPGSLQRVVKCISAYEVPLEFRTRWLLLLEYSVMIRCFDLLSNRKVSATVMAHELITQSHAGTLDPRKVFWIAHNYHEVIRCEVPAQSRLRVFRAQSYSRIEPQLATCPEVAIYQVLVEDRHLDSECDLFAESVRPIALRLLQEKNNSTLHKYTPETFRDACLRVIAREGS